MPEEHENKIEHTHFLDDVNEETSSTSPIPVIPELGVALGMLVVIFSATYIGASNALTKDSSIDDNDVRVLNVIPNDEKPLTLGTAFEGVKLQAKAAIVWDAKTHKVLFNKNADEQLPLASVTKLMTALVAYELLSPDEKVSIGMNALQVEGDSGFVDGEQFTVRDLADITLISSSNDGAAALSAAAGSAITEDFDPEATFVRAMNLKAEELGLTQTYFSNSTGLDVSETQAGAYGSARDMALLMEYIIMNVADAVALTRYDATVITSEDGSRHTARNTNEIVEELDGLIASKTGYTLLAGGNLVIAFNAGLNHPVIVAVLGSTERGRFQDMLTLVERARAYIGASE